MEDFDGTNDCPKGVGGGGGVIDWRHRRRRCRLIYRRPRSILFLRRPAEVKKKRKSEPPTYFFDAPEINNNSYSNNRNSNDGAFFISIAGRNVFFLLSISESTSRTAIGLLPSFPGFVLGFNGARGFIFVDVLPEPALYYGIGSSGAWYSEIFAVVLVGSIRFFFGQRIRQ